MKTCKLILWPWLARISLFVLLMFPKLFSTENSDSKLKVLVFANKISFLILIRSSELSLAEDGKVPKTGESWSWSTKTINRSENKPDVSDRTNSQHSIYSLTQFHEKSSNRRFWKILACHQYTSTSPVHFSASVKLSPFSVALEKS